MKTCVSSYSFQPMLSSGELTQLQLIGKVKEMGFDGIELGRYMTPQLTTIRQHKERIASRSVEILLDCISENRPAVHEITSFHLIPGESVGKI